jgi:hypothetical protein
MVSQTAENGSDSVSETDHTTAYADRLAESLAADWPRRQQTAEATPAALAHHMGEAGRVCATGATAKRQPSRSPADLASATEHPAQTWAGSGLMALTGNADGPPQLCPAPLASAARGVLAAWCDAAPLPALRALDGAQLLGERAALFGLQRQGSTAPGGSCRLLRTVDGHLALNLARDDDRDAMAAWLQADISGTTAAGCWDAVTAAVAGHETAELVDRGRLLGLAVAPLQRPAPPSAWFHRGHRGRATTRPAAARPLVVDLSPLWAGPLCGHLLMLAGAEVIKVESRSRPDGARRGNANFYDLLNAGKASVALDFDAAQGRDALRALLLQADVVIEASRPRALRQLGIHAEELIDARPGLSWIGICGHGRDGDAENWIGFGDDAGVAGGLSALMLEVTGLPLFCGDAIGDPLTGLHAALLAWSSWRAGGGELLWLSLSEVVAHCAGDTLALDAGALRRRHHDWSEWLTRHGIAPAMPRARPVIARAAASGADNAAVAARLGIHL